MWSNRFLLSLLGLLCLITTSAFANKLGVIGALYPIAEPDLLQVIQKRVTTMGETGEISQLEYSLQNAVQSHLDRPMPVTRLYRTQKARTFLFNPAMQLGGQLVDPLTDVTLPQALFFYDADDPSQERLAQHIAQKEGSKALFILVGGSIARETQRFQQRVYFDQDGRLVNRFQIQHVPAFVTQQGDQLRIQELVP